MMNTSAMICVTVRNAIKLMIKLTVRNAIKLMIKFCCSWVVYDDEDFSGPRYKLKPGEYPNAEAWGGRDDELSSVKPDQ